MIGPQIMAQRFCIGKEIRKKKVPVLRASRRICTASSLPAPTTWWSRIRRQRVAIPGAQPVRIFKILLKAGLHKDVVLNSGFDELFCSSLFTAGAVTLSKVRREEYNKSW